MKKLLLLTSFMMMGLIAYNQEVAELTVEVSNDSILLGNYTEVRFTIKNAAVENFEAPSFEGFNIVSGPNQSSSMMISNGEMTQSVAYSYYIEPIDIGNYFISPAFVDTDKGVLESIPVEILVVDNPEGIIQQPKRNQGNSLFNQKDLFGGDSFFGGSDLFNDFFNNEKNPFFQDMEPFIPQKSAKPKKKKRKVYKL